MSDYKALTLAETACRLLEIENPLILIHVKPDGDCYGSAAALSQLFRLLGKRAAVYCADPIPERLRFIDDLAEFTPYDEKAAYTALSVDVASPAQLGDAEGRFPLALQIDHHAKGSFFADHYVDPNAAAAGEIVYALACELLKDGKITEIPPRLASAIYTAISSDTGGFRQANTTASSHEVAAELYRLGAVAHEIDRAIFEAKTPRQMRAEAEVMANIRLHENGRIASFITTKKSRDEKGLSTEDFETSVDIVRAVGGVEIAVVVKEADTRPNTYKVSFRSVKADVAAVAAAFGGGGHILAAGCTVEAENAEKALAMVLEKL